MISKIYGSNQILKKTWSRKGKKWFVLELENWLMKDKKILTPDDMDRIKYLRTLVKKEMAKKKKRGHPWRRK